MKDKIEIVKEMDNSLFVLMNENGEYLTQSQGSLKWTTELNKARIYKGYREGLKKSESLYQYQKMGTVLVSVELKIKE
jgi:hypothetical protein